VVKPPTATLRMPLARRISFSPVPAEALTCTRGGRNRSRSFGRAEGVEVRRLLAADLHAWRQDLVAVEGAGVGPVEIAIVCE